MSLARAAGEGLRGQRARMREAREIDMVSAVRAGLVAEVCEVPGPHVLSWGRLCDVHPTEYPPQAMRVVDVSPRLLAAFRAASSPSLLGAARCWLRKRFGLAPRIIGRGFEGNAYLANGSGDGGG